MMNYLIKNAYIITQNKQREELIGDILIKKGIISYVGNKYVGNMNNLKIIDANGLVVLPGFINAHIHLGESIFLDYFKGKYSLDEYISLTDKIYIKNKQIESKRKYIAEYSTLIALKSGITTIGGSRVHKASQNMGIRTVSGYMLMNTEKLNGFSHDFMRKYIDFKKEMGPLDEGCLFIHSLNYVNKDILKKIKSICTNNDNIMIHIAETKEQEDLVKKRFGKSSIEILDDLGILTNKTILIHCNFISRTDKKKIIEKNAKIVHCLSSNMKVANKTLRIGDLIKSGIDTAIATDGLITSGGLDILQEAKWNYIYHNRFGKNILPTHKILDMITIDAAKVLGKEKEIGSIENNKRADIIFVRMAGNGNHIEKILFYNPPVSGNMIDGKLIVWNEKLLHRDEKKICNIFNKIITSLHD